MSTPYDPRQQPGQPQQQPPPHGQPNWYPPPASGAQSFGGPPPQRPGNKKPWIIGGVILGVLAIAATVLIIVLNKDDDGTKASADNSGSSLTCAPGEYGIKVAPNGDSITCSGSGADSGTGSTDDSGPTGSAPAPETGADGLLPDNHYFGDWKVTVADPDFNPSPPEDQKPTDAFPKKMDWSIAGGCAEKIGCTMPVDLGNGMLITVSYQPENDVYVGEAPMQVTCKSGTASATVQLRLYDYVAGSSGTTGSLVLNGPADTCKFGQAVYLLSMDRS